MSELDPIYQSATLPEIAKSLHGIHLLVSENFSRLDAQMGLVVERIGRLDDDVRDHEVRIRQTERSLDLVKAVENHEERLREMDDRTNKLTVSLESLLTNLAGKREGITMTAKVAWTIAGVAITTLLAVIVALATNQ